MPKYYFNVHNVSPSVDDLGAEFPDNEAAWREATRFAGDHFKEIDGKLQWTLEVADETRRTVFLIQIEGKEIGPA